MLNTLKLTFFVAFLILASLFDLQTMECPDAVHICIVLIGSLGTSFSCFFKRILIAMVILGLLIGLDFILGGKIGGADIKLIAASSIVIKYNALLVGVMIGLILAIICELCKGNKGNAFPLIPYLAQGMGIITILGG